MPRDKEQNVHSITIELLMDVRKPQFSLKTDIGQTLLCYIIFHVDKSKSKRILRNGTKQYNPQYHLGDPVSAISVFFLMSTYVHMQY